MVESVQNQIKKLLPTVEELYTKLVLVVGESSSGKTAVLLDAAKELCCYCGCSREHFQQDP